jgi:hypothetical protein
MCTCKADVLPLEPRTLLSFGLLIYFRKVVMIIVNTRNITKTQINFPDNFRLQGFSMRKSALMKTKYI